MNNIQNNQRYLTYNELITMVSSELEKRLRREKFKYVFYLGSEKIVITNLMIANTILKTLKNTSPFIGFLIAIHSGFLPITSSTSTLFLHLGAPIIGLGIKKILSSENVKNILEDKIPDYCLVPLEKNKDFHNSMKDLHIIRKSNINLLPEYLFSTLFSSKEQYSLQFSREWIEIIIKLLSSFSLTSITFSIALGNIDKLEENCFSPEIATKINDLSETSLNNITSSLDHHKQHCRDSFNAGLFVSSQYTRYNLTDSPNKNSSLYFEILERIAFRIDNEIFRIEKKINSLNNKIQKQKNKLAYTTDYNQKQHIIQTIDTLMNERNSLSNELNMLITKKSNLKNWFTTCSDILKSNELSLKLTDEKEESIYNLLSYFRISTITLCLFEGKLDLLPNILKSVPTPVSNDFKTINDLTDEILSKYQGLKQIALNDERQSYESKLQDILTSHKSI